MTGQARSSDDPVRPRLLGPTIGCADAFELADFYAWLLGWEVADRSEKVPGGWAVVRSPSGEQKLEFQREDPFVPPVWPTAIGEPQVGMHLDIAVGGLPPTDEGLARYHAFRDELVARGAREADYQPQAARGVIVMLDPAGHPFCLCPHP